MQDKLTTSGIAFPLMCVPVDNTSFLMVLVAHTTFTISSSRNIQNPAGKSRV
jgi:hypothetical protein